MIELLRSFIIGGLIISGVKFLSSYVGPQYGPLLSGIPLGMLAVFFLDNDDKKVAYYKGYLYSTFTLFITAFLVNILIHSFTNPSINTLTFFAIIFWLIVSFTAIKLLV